MSLMMTLAPSRTKMREHASPMPDAPPVTIATLPFSLPLVMSVGARFDSMVLARPDCNRRWMDLDFPGSGYPVVCESAAA